jgi:hypothetical protein
VPVLSEQVLVLGQVPVPVLEQVLVLARVQVRLPKP